MANYLSGRVTRHMAAIEAAAAAKALEEQELEAGRPLELKETAEDGLTPLTESSEAVVAVVDKQDGSAHVSSPGHSPKQPLPGGPLGLQ